MFDTDRLTRRQLLELTGAGITGGLAGCTGSGGSSTPTEQEATTGTATPTETSTATPTPRFHPANDQAVHLLTSFANDNWQDVWETQIAPDFTDQTGIPLNVEYTGVKGTSEQRLATLMQAGNPPDAFTAETLSLVGNLLIQGQLVPVNETVEYITKRIGDVIVPQPIINGNAYIVPHGIYAGTIHYRQDIIEQLNLTPPKTWEAYRRNAKAISEDKSIDAHGVAVAGAKSGMSDSYYDVFYNTNNGDFVKWNEDKTEAVMWFPEEKALETLEYLVQLSEYSPAPGSVNWGPVQRFWTAGRVAQTYNVNAFGAGVAAGAGAGTIVKNTELAPIPKRKGVDPIERSFATIAGYTIIEPADNPGGALKLFRWMYDDPEQSARYYLTQPGRLLPAYSKIFETDTYQNAKIFKKYPHLLDLNIQVRDEIAPLNVQEVATPATLYASRFPIIAQMMNEVLVGGRPPKPAIKDAKDRYAKRLKEGKKKARS